MKSCLFTNLSSRLILLQVALSLGLPCCSTAEEPRPTAFLGYYLTDSAEVFMDLPEANGSPTDKVRTHVRIRMDSFVKGSSCDFDTITVWDTIVENYIQRNINLNDTFYIYDNRGLIGSFRFKNYMYLFNGASGNDYWYLRLVPFGPLRKWPWPPLRNPVILPSSKNRRPFHVYHDTYFLMPVTEYIHDLDLSPREQDEEWGTHYYEYRLRDSKNEIEIRVINRFNPDQPAVEFRIFRKTKEILTLYGDHLGC